MPLVANPQETILLDLNPQDADRLIIKPSLGYHNPLQNQMGIYEVITDVRNKVTMNHLQEDDNILQPKSDCNTWNPTVSHTLASHQFGITDYEVNGEMCTDEWMKGVTRLSLNPGVRSIYFEGATSLNALEQAMVMMTSRALTNSTFKSVWFSDPNFDSVEDPWSTADLSHLSPEMRVKLATMLTQQSGLWSQIYAYTQDESTLLHYVDTNDGTAGGNMLDPANIVTLFDEMMLQAEMTLQHWGDSLTDENQRPVYLVQPGLFFAYKKYLQSLGTEESHRVIVNGQAMRGILEYDGYMVINMPEWDKFDKETGRMHPTTRRSRHQRAILTVPRNLTIGANVQPLSGFPGSGFIIERNPSVRAKGKKYMYYAMGLGMSFAHDELMVAAYNSDISTFA